MRKSVMKSKNVALVLGSGGARGIAHIAIIEALTKAGFTITSIAGSSIGAVIGGIYAGGHLQGYKDWLTTLNYWDVFRLMDFSISTKGFIKGEKVFKKINPFLPSGTIEDLPIPFVAVAADIIAKKQVNFTSGSVIEAIRASMSIPTILKPVERDETVYVDGSVVNPIPVDVVPRTENDVLVVADLNAHIKPPKVAIPTAQQSKLDKLAAKYLNWHSNQSGKNNLGVFSMLNESFDLTQDMLADKILMEHQPDIHIKISRKAAGTMDFHRADELLAMGKQAAQKAIASYQNDLII